MADLVRAIHTVEDLALVDRVGPPSRVGVRRVPVVLTSLFLAMITAGCQGGGAGPLARWRTAMDDRLSKPPSAEEAGDTRGFLASWFAPKMERTNIARVLGLESGSDPRNGLQPSPPDPAAQAEFEAAEALYQQGRLAEAESAFQKIAKKRKETNWGEKAQFYLAESQFQLGKLVAAHDGYEVLLAKYPGTRFLDKAVEREFAIAQTWMEAVDPNAPPEKKASVAGWWSGRHPGVDLTGHALAVLEHVRHHDPLGPLADDAVMKIADHHFAAGNYEDASYYYDQLITEHPKSELLRTAHLKSIDSKLKGYIGPDYDGSGLEDARKLALQTMTMFPEQQASYSEELDQTLALIEDQMAERAYRRGEHYLWTGKVASAEFCFGEIGARWPQSPWAGKAKEQLAKIALMPRRETKASKMMALPGSTDPITGSPGAGAGGFGGMGMGGMGMGGIGGVGGP